ncbi:MAG: hypothetical protein RL757_2954 [Bacteroidota bacterium]|jgi:hypothetical protein
MRKIILVIIILLPFIGRAQKVADLLKNTIGRVDISVNYGKNRSSYANPSWFGGADSLVDQRKRLVTPRITNRYGFGAGFGFIKTFRYT